jgi:large subunit ribosomal protein L4
MKAAALRGALSDRARNGRVHVVTGFVEGDTPSTRDAVSALTALSQRPNLLVVMPRADVLGWKSLRNAPGVHLLFPDQLNTYDVLISDDVVFTRAALDEFIAGRAQGRSVKASAREDELAPRAADEIDGADEDVADHDAAAEVHAADDGRAAADQVVTPPQAAVDEALGTEAAVDEAAVDAAADDAAGRKESTP